MKRLVCELCGSGDFTKDPDGLFVCDFCRTKYTPAQAQSMVVEGTVRIDRSGEVDNLITLSADALASNNYQAGYEYANRALEIDPVNGSAWFAKGAGAGVSSTIQDFRVLEMTNAFKSSIQFTAEEDREAVRRRAAAHVNGASKACYKMTRDHLGSNIASEPGTWDAHVARCQEVIGALQISYQWNPDREPLDTITTIASDLIRGVLYETSRHGGKPIVGGRTLTPQAMQEMQVLIDSTAEEIKRLDPSHVGPERHMAPKSGCFVVSATMGDESALPVLILREFRDAVLENYGAGRRFINSYYDHGPAIANVIQTSRALRSMSFVLIVAPATAIAWVVMRLQRARQ